MDVLLNGKLYMDVLYLKEKITAHPCDEFTFNIRGLSIWTTRRLPGRESRGWTSQTSPDIHAWDAWDAWDAWAWNYTHLLNGMAVPWLFMAFPSTRPGKRRHITNHITNWKITTNFMGSFSRHFDWTFWKTAMRNCQRVNPIFDPIRYIDPT